jgi:dipeptidyl aminopeptidase/acylaminoacyl peptidase
MPEFQPADSFAPEVSPDGHYLAFARRILGGQTTIAGHAFNFRTALWLRDLRSGEERVLMDPIDPDRTGVYARGVLRVVNGYCWVKDSSALIVPVNGKLRRVAVESGRVSTIPFRVHVHRQLSEMARASVDLSGDQFPVKFLETAATSPNGKSVVLYGAGQLWIRDRGGSTPRPLAAMSDRVQMMPAWSPDGQWIAFVGWKDGELGSVWKIPAAGGKAQRLTLAGGEYLYPSWSPDGKQIAVASGSLETSRGDSVGANPYWYLSVVPAAGGKLVEKTQLPGLTPIHWQADGRIYYLDFADHVEALEARIQSGRCTAVTRWQTRELSLLVRCVSCRPAFNRTSPLHRLLRIERDRRRTPALDGGGMVSPLAECSDGGVPQRHASLFL